MAFGSSQGLSYGDVMTQQEAPKRARVEEKQSCIPVTVRILRDSIARHADSQELLLHGTEATIVHIVGVVESLVQQAATVEFQLNDASGRMTVRYYGSDGDKKGLADGKYVNIVGSVRTSPTAHISAMNLQAVQSADEISYHMIECAHAALRMRNPTKAAGLSMGISAADPITPSKQAAPATLSPAKTEAPAPLAAPAAVAMQTPVKKDLRTSLVDLMRQVQDSGDAAEGISIASLLTRLTEVPSEKVRDVLSQLVDEGDVYTTIDDEHFAML